ncbi:MAG: hypothetical protein AAGB26_02050 [Planctomycetota bacterium]
MTDFVSVVYAVSTIHADKRSNIPFFFADGTIGQTSSIDAIAKRATIFNNT